MRHACLVCCCLGEQANLDQMIALSEQQLHRRARSATIQELQQLAAVNAAAAVPLGSSGYQQCGCSQLDDMHSLGGNGSCLDCGAYVTPAWWSLKVGSCHVTCLEL